jgi:hypothetical protein
VYQRKEGNINQQHQMAELEFKLYKNNNNKRFVVRLMLGAHDET